MICPWILAVVSFVDSAQVDFNYIGVDAGICL